MSHKCQQSELYAAERLVPSGRDFHSVEQIQRFVDDLRETWWWRMWYPNVLRVDVAGRPARCGESVGAYQASHRAGVIEMLRCHWNERVVLHELAHVLAEARYGSRAHDPAFARVYLELVALALPEAIYGALYEAFTRAGINFDWDDTDRLGQARRMPSHTAY